MSQKALHYLHELFAEVRLVFCSCMPPYSLYGLIETVLLKNKNKNSPLTSHGQEPENLSPSSSDRVDISVWRALQNIIIIIRRSGTLIIWNSLGRLLH